MIKTFVCLFLFLNSFVNCENDYEGEIEAATNIKFYRRMEMLVSNFEYDYSVYNDNCDGDFNNCNLTTYTRYNHISETRQISLREEYDETWGIHLYHTEVWEEPPHITSVYNEDTELVIKIEIHNPRTKWKTTIFQKIYEDIIFLHPNTEKRIFIDYNKEDDYFVLQNAEVKTFGIFISYRCKGYTGVNCQHNCYDENDKIECDFETGIKFCKDPQYNNPPDCNKVETECSTVNAEKCKNGGVCELIYNEIFICNCVNGYRGQYCEDFYCDPPCDPDHGDCVGPNQCKCNKKYKGGTYCNETICGEEKDSPCENGAACRVYENELFCLCNPEEYAGRFCQIKCNPPCVFGHCAYLNNTKFCSCFKGFEGDDCSIAIPKSAPVYERFYVSPQTQKITYAVLFFVLFFITVGVFGGGAYMRKKIKRNIEIVLKTEARLTQMTNTINESNSMIQHNENETTVHDRFG